MTWEEVNEMWSKDKTLDITDLVRATADIPELHNKYYVLYIKQHLRTMKMKADLVMLEAKKTEYFNGTMSEEDLKKFGWKPNPLKIMKAEIPRHIESDPDVQTLSLKIGYAQAVEEYLKDILKNINNRNFLIKNIIEQNKFAAGGGY